MYQIFPDRFFNGDSSNDYLKKYSRGFDPVEYHSNWYELPDNPNDKNKPGYTGDGIWSNDFFGGDLQGIDDKLDYLKSLGISVIYLNPIFNHLLITGTIQPITQNRRTIRRFIYL
ncbi:alpha amylase catalytic region [Thermoanaerobacter ethanolicus JW 200]|nr:alpha amylase catalytic region [Thermoanaerobacter ethanolicus JW 200]